MKYNQFEENIILKLNALEKLICRIDKRLGSVNLNDNFNISGREKAAKILACSVGKLDKIIKEGTIIKENLHYRKGERLYKFSEQALLSIKGQM